MMITDWFLLIANVKTLVHLISNIGEPYRVAKCIQASGSQKFDTHELREAGRRVSPRLKVDSIKVSVLRAQKMADNRVGVRISILTLTYFPSAAHARLFRISCPHSLGEARISVTGNGDSYTAQPRTNFRIWLRSRLDKMAARIPCWRRYIRPRCGAARIHTIRGTAGHAGSDIPPYIRIPMGIPVHVFLHHRAVTYAAEMAGAEPGSKYEIKTWAAGV